MKASSFSVSPSLWLALLVFFLGIGSLNAQTEQAFEDAIKLEDNWYHLDWFGYFMIRDNDWIYHLEHGWMYLSWGDETGLGKVKGEFWLHDMDMGWWWINSQQYPYIYSFPHNNWLWYVSGSSVPRWFYCFCNCSWESFPATVWEIPPGPPTGLVEIPAGLFTMGQVLNKAHYSVPEHTVFLDAFYIGTHEVTKELWDEVYEWALCNDYTFDNLGKGESVEHPVANVNWYDVVKWCNAYSQMEHRDPVYFTDASKTEVFKVGNLDIGNDSVDWDANGYRLPTESEWEKASRGGLVGSMYPWGNWVPSVANKLNYGITPGKALVGGQYAPNGYALYDIAGNLGEWTWDWYDEYSADSQTNPRGPSSGTERVYRGGSWSQEIFRARCADRSETKPWNPLNILGFRVVSSAQ